MNNDQARAAVQSALNLIAPDIDLNEVDSGSRLRQDLELDSLDFLRLVEAIDMETGISIPESDYPKVSTVAGLIEYLAATGRDPR